MPFGYGGIFANDGVERAYSEFLDAIDERLDCTCPSLDPLDKWSFKPTISSLLRLAANNTPAVSPPDCGFNVPFDNFTARIGSSINMAFPSTCSWESWEAGQPCSFSFNMTKTMPWLEGAQVEFMLDHCPGRTFPFISLSASGSVFENMMKPCSSDLECGPYTCDSLTVGHVVAEYSCNNGTFCGEEWGNGFEYSSDPWWPSYSEQYCNSTCPGNWSIFYNYTIEDPFPLAAELYQSIFTAGFWYGDNNGNDDCDTNAFFGTNYTQFPAGSNIFESLLETIILPSVGGSTTFNSSDIAFCGLSTLNLTADPSMRACYDANTGAYCGSAGFSPGAPIDPSFLQSCNMTNYTVNYTNDWALLPFELNCTTPMVDEWDGTMSGGVMANAAGRKDGTALNQFFPSSDLNTSRTTLLRFDCQHTLQLLPESTVKSAAYTLQDLNPKAQQFLDFLSDLQQCRAGLDTRNVGGLDAFEQECPFYQVGPALRIFTADTLSGYTKPTPWRTFAQNMSEEFQWEIDYGYFEYIEFPESCSADTWASTGSCNFEVTWFESLFGDVRLGAEISQCGDAPDFLPTFEIYCVGADCESTFYLHNFDVCSQASDCAHISGCDTTDCCGLLDTGYMDPGLWLFLDDPYEGGEAYEFVAYVSEDPSTLNMTVFADNIYSYIESVFNTQYYGGFDYYHFNESSCWPSCTSLADLLRFDKKIEVSAGGSSVYKTYDLLHSSHNYSIGNTTDWVYEVYVSVNPRSKDQEDWESDNAAWMLWPSDLARDLHRNGFQFYGIVEGQHPWAFNAEANATTNAINEWYPWPYDWDYSYLGYGHCVYSGCNPTPMHMDHCNCTTCWSDPPSEWNPYPTCYEPTSKPVHWTHEYELESWDYPVVNCDGGWNDPGTCFSSPDTCTNPGKTSANLVQALNVFAQNGNPTINYTDPMYAGWTATVGICRPEIVGQIEAEVRNNGTTLSPYFECRNVTGNVTNTSECFTIRGFVGMPTTPVPTTTTTAGPTTTAGATTSAGPTTTAASPNTTAPGSTGGSGGNFVVYDSWGSIPSTPIASGHFVVFKQNITAEIVCEDEELDVDLTSTGDFRVAAHFDTYYSECDFVLGTNYTWTDVSDGSDFTDCATSGASCTSSGIELGSLSTTYDNCVVVWCDSVTGCDLSGVLTLRIDPANTFLPICGAGAVEIATAVFVALIAMFV